MTASPVPRPKLSWLWLAAAFAVLPACHHATEQECEQILDRIVELELKDRGINDPETVKLRAAETKAKKHDALIRSCVGKRIGSSNMKCIQEAQSAADITDKCLR